LSIGIAFAIVLVEWQSRADQGRVQVLKQNATQAVDLPSPMPPNTAKIGGSFALTSQDGNPVTDKDFAGKYLLVYFGYTQCPDMCPTGLKSISIAMDRLSPEGQGRVQPLFITVDPARDNPARLKQYDSTFNAKIIGLTGAPDQIAAVAKEYQAYYQKGEGEDDYEIEHTTLIYLMNPAGQLVSTFDEETDPALIIAALQKDMAGQAPSKP
jgi:protein SCO1/2